MFIALGTGNVRICELAGIVPALSQQLQAQEADHPQEIEKKEEEGREAGCGFGEIGENYDFTSPRKRLR